MNDFPFQGKRKQQEAAKQASQVAARKEIGEVGTQAVARHGADAMHADESGRRPTTDVNHIDGEINFWNKMYAGAHAQQQLHSSAEAGVSGHSSTEAGVSGHSSTEAGVSGSGSKMAFWNMMHDQVHHHSSP